jgi:hypothetical protein
MTTTAVPEHPPIPGPGNSGRFKLGGDDDEVDSLRIDFHDLGDNEKAHVLMASSADGTEPSVDLGSAP